MHFFPQATPVEERAEQRAVDEARDRACALRIEHECEASAELFQGFDRTARWAAAVAVGGLAVVSASMNALRAEHWIVRLVVVLAVLAWVVCALSAGLTLFHGVHGAVTGKQLKMASIAAIKARRYRDRQLDAGVGDSSEQHARNLAESAALIAAEGRLIDFGLKVMHRASRAQLVTLVAFLGGLLFATVAVIAALLST